MIDQNTINDLVSQAIKQSDMAYSPYSNFNVGAALLCDDGTVFLGCNVENASYGATNCAERSAIFAAVSKGFQKFSAIAIAGHHKGQEIDAPCPPCGICRQVMSEFCDPDFMIYLAKKDGYVSRTLSELLPATFDLLEK